MPLAFRMMWTCFMIHMKPWQIIENLPENQIGTCVLDMSSNLFRGSPETLLQATAKQELYFHLGSICCAWPRVITAPEKNVSP